MIADEVATDEVYYWVKQGENFTVQFLRDIADQAEDLVSQYLRDNQEFIMECMQEDAKSYTEGTSNS